MLERERKETILRLLDLHTYTTIHDVVEATGASEATIRRDFIQLEQNNFLRRVRGGVELIPSENGNERHHELPSFNRRKNINREKKRRIAKKAASYISEGDTIIIDGGTTTFHMVEYIASMSLQVITNSFAVAEHLINHSNCTVILPEGTVDPNSQLILNNLSSDPFQNYTAFRAFMGIEGITKNTLTNNDPLVIQTERAMIEHAQEVVILADESKFHIIGSLTLCPIERVTRIITTGDADPQRLSAIREHGVDVQQI
ncbi:MAG: DeoR/GlpR family DNA-binding transcription regulator [Spirochaetales bacterium]|nr:DeoR/GlpR family DNA-binding transcription regulator [Spirochaetales bacterium]MCF7938331.1 DeoR/GlpR family DNA-binding transcription regulator [Spirochaetales bacterium]